MFQNLLEWSNEKKLKFRGNRVNILLWESQHIWFGKIKANSQFHNLHLNSAKTYGIVENVRSTLDCRNCLNDIGKWNYMRAKNQIARNYLNCLYSSCNSQILKRTRSFSPAAQERVFWLFQTWSLCNRQSLCTGTRLISTSQSFDTNS